MDRNDMAMNKPPKVVQLLTLPLLAILSSPTARSYGAAVAPAAMSADPTVAPVKIAPARESRARGIRIQDDGYGLSPARLDEIRLFIEGLPQHHLAGLKRIVIGVREGPLDPNRMATQVGLDASGVLTMRFEPDESTLAFLLARGVGASVYRNVLSQEERAAWLAITGVKDPARGEMTFAGYYFQFVTYAQSRFHELTREISEPPLSGEAPKETLAELFVASLFINAGTANIQAFDRDPRLTSLRRDAFRTDRWLTLGMYNYRLENGAITGLTVGDVYAARSSDAASSWDLIECRWKSPIGVPKLILDRFPLRQGGSTRTVVPVPPAAVMREVFARGIKIQDRGCGFSDAELEMIKRLIEALPERHVAGLKQIILRPTAEQPDSAFAGIAYIGSFGSVLNDRGVVTVYLPSLRSAINLRRVMAGVGRNVYRNVMSQAERAAWRDLMPEYYPTYHEASFSSFYEMQVSYGMRLQHEPSGELPEGELSEDTSKSSLGKLLVASLFVDPEAGNIWMCDCGEEDFSVAHRRAFRTDRWLTIGRINYQLENGAIAGVTIGDTHASAGRDLVDPPLQSRRWQTPVTVPQVILDRFPLRD